MKRLIFLLAAALSFGISLSAADVAGILKATYEKPGVAESFKVGDDWYPYPKYSDREAWDKFFPAQTRKDVIKKGKKYLGYKWQHIPASTFIALKTTGDKQALRRIEGQNREAFCNLMLAELAEGKGRFLMDIADGLWFYGTSWHWSISNQTYGKLPRYEMEKIALGNVKIAVTVIIGWHFFRDEINRMDPAICATFEETVKRIILDPSLDGYGTKKFKWMGPTNSKRNNWNPWCNHGALLAFLFMEKDQDRLNAAVKASVENVDLYLKAYASDGACEEGAGYWGQSVGRFCEYLQLLKDASRGAFDVMPNEFISSMANYRSRAFAGVDANSNRAIFVNFADGNSSHSPNEGGQTYWKVGKLFGNPEMCNLALYYCADLKTKKFIFPKLNDEEGYRLLESARIYNEYYNEVKKLNDRIAAGESFEDVRSSLRKDVPHRTWYPDTQQVMLRTGDGWFLAAKAGHNDEVHGHNDVGSFVLYMDNVRIFADPGVGTYTAKTFGKDRYTLWTMVADWHNCPAPNGVNQIHGREYAAASCTLDQKGRTYTMTSELAPAYLPEAHCKSYVRKLVLSDSDTKSKLTVEDSFSLGERSAADDIHFITPGTVRIVKEGVIEINCGNKTVQMTYPSSLKASIEEKQIEEDNLKRQWDGVLRRIVFKSSPKAPLEGKYKFVITQKRIL